MGTSIATITLGASHASSTQVRTSFAYVGIAVSECSLWAESCASINISEVVGIGTAEAFGVKRSIAGRTFRVTRSTAIEHVPSIFASIAVSDVRTMTRLASTITIGAYHVCIVFVIRGIAFLGTEAFMSNVIGGFTSKTGIIFTVFTVTGASIACSAC